MKGVAVRAAVVVASVYGYFLIFAQFAFVELLRAGGAGVMAEKVALGMMAAAGIGGGFVAAWRGASPKLVRGALGLAALCSLLAPVANSLPGSLAIAMATGAALGIATVSLASMLPAWCGVAWVGVGTGLGYAMCNVPGIFTLSPAGQAWVGTGFALAGVLAVPSVAEWRGHEIHRVFPLWAAIAVFTALVWLDSAAFFIIQHSADLKGGTWSHDLLWRNAAVHLAVAAAAGFWLARGRAKLLPCVAWGILAIAAWAVNQDSSRVLAGWLYPAGVSIYSAALVAWPGWFSGSNGPRQAGWRAAWLFAIAGWFGSANGIGMAETLHEVPPAFIVISGVVVAGAMALSDLSRWRSVATVGVVTVTVLAFRGKRPAAVDSAFERGHQVYLSEGCIHCHSQYVRPGSIDEEIWGPARGVGESLKGNPVLIGNRRQGPDLTNVGARRSETWLKLHFMNPGAFVPGTAMPSYGHLFDSGKGDDLVRYLKQAGEAQTSKVVATAGHWSPRDSVPAGNGPGLFAMNCAACHGATGEGDGPAAGALVRKPANLVAGPFAWTPAGEDLELRVARVIKFGIPGTDMPGHEVLTDSQVTALGSHVLKLRGGR